MQFFLFNPYWDTIACVGLIAVVMFILGFFTCHSLHRN
jgi:uncharacterized membrane protein